MKLGTVIAVITIMLIMAVSSPVAMADSHLKYDDIAGEFSCQCGCNSGLKDCQTMKCETKESLKGTIDKMIDEGKSKSEIILAMRTDYSDLILSAPPKEGFNLVAWAAPFLLVIAGSIGLVARLVVREVTFIPF